MGWVSAKDIRKDGRGLERLAVQENATVSKAGAFL
jgi:hypothetical protein